MNQLADTLEWPLTVPARVVRGKFYNESNAHKTYKAIRITDHKTGRYFYDLYDDEEVYLTRVNPLFLDFFEY